MRFTVSSAAAAIAIVMSADVAFRGSAAPATDVVKVLTFNIQHGIDGSHKYNLQRSIDAIAKLQPDVVGLQEVTRNHPYYNCDDQPARIADGLNAATGRAWSVAYEQEWFTPNVECQQSGRGDGKETEGLAFLAPAPLGPPSVVALPVSRIALAVKPPSLKGVTVVVTHLASGRKNVEARQKEVEALLKWTHQFGPRQILMGDFNAKPGDVELAPVLTVFRDVWQLGTQAGIAKGGEATHGQNRIDYMFLRSDDVELVGVEAIDTAGWFGAAASDHKPLLAAFRLRGPT